MVDLTDDKRTAVIVGAGFSRSLGVPAYADVMETIAKPLDKSKYNLDDIQTEIDMEITKHICDFLNAVFECDVDNCDEIPSLEQVFTFIDLSAGAGHNLGKDYTPGKLRALRRFLIYKLFLIIDKLYAVPSNNFVEKLLLCLKNSNFISLNWDIVLEKNLHAPFTYGIDETEVCLNGGRLASVCSCERRNDTAIKIAKIHGSANWVYCDNCHKIFSMKNKKTAKVIQSGIYVEDIKKFYQPHETDSPKMQALKTKIRNEAEKKKCPDCNCALGSHIATFSYRKSFRTHAFETSWKLAENILSESARWIFIGYSLPEADFEFAHMLKYVQKRTDVSKEIIAVTKEDEPANVKRRFESLFGKDIHFFNEGLEHFVNTELDFVPES